VAASSMLVTAARRQPGPVLPSASRCGCGEPTPASAEDEPGALARVRAGLAFTLGDRLLRALVGTSAIYNLFDQWIFTLFTLFAARQLGLPAAAIGLILSAGGAGAVAGSLLPGPPLRG
jgi:hypothetical protein